MNKNVLILILFISNITIGQNSMIGDGFGGRLWYSPTNFGVGSYSAYSICSDSIPNQLYGWGNNGYNQLGLGTSISGADLPTSVPNMMDVSYFSSGYIMGAVKNDSTGWVWGTYGINFSSNPTQVISDVYFLDAGSRNISFVKYDGTVWSMGLNTNGQLGDGTTVDSPTIPVQMQSINNAVRVSNNAISAIVLLSDSTLKSVGVSPGLGIPSVPQTLTPLPIQGLPKIVDIQSDLGRTIALSDSGYVYEWGFGTSSGIPVKVDSLSDIVAISACDDGFHFMALDVNMNCYVWGQNIGQMGLPSTAFTNTPTLVATNVIDIMAGESFSYIVKADYSLWATGKSWADSSGMSIWLNITDTARESFVQIDPSQIPGGCEVLSTSVTSKWKSVSSEIPFIYPNPTSNYFTIEGLTKRFNLSIYNSLGQLIHSEFNVLDHYKRIDVTQYTRGILYVRIDAEDEIYNLKVFKP